MRRNINTAHSKGMKVELKDNCITICGESGREDSDVNKTETDNSDDESLEAYNGFV